MTTLLGPLREHGYIERRVDAARARRLLLSLTSEGAGIIEDARALSPAIEGDLLEGFTAEERQTPKRQLGRIARRLA